MFLSKKWILILIALTGSAFMILLVIQFGWMEKSLNMNQQQLELRIRENSLRIRQSFLADKAFQATYLAKPGQRKDFISETNTVNAIGNAIKLKIDSILQLAGTPFSAAVHTITGSYCYLMDVVPAGERNHAVDHSQFKICLCNNSCPLRLDVGFNLRPGDKGLDAGSSALVLPSVFLILLLIGIFSYAIYIINRQKRFADLKNDFINNLTHEFNTPLFSIGITNNLLLRSDAVQQSTKLKEYVDLVSIEKNRIQSQVDKILQLTALESGGMIMEKETVDMHQLIRDSMQSFQNLVKEKGGTMRFSANTTNSAVTGDRLHLLNALNNLLDNACKYSEAPPAVLITTENYDNNLLIKVADDGIGISKRDRNMIFQKFYRVKQGDRHDVKGFGLGLSYVKKIIELHLGGVGIETKTGKGTVFFIRLPNTTNK